MENDLLEERGFVKITVRQDIRIWVVRVGGGENYLRVDVLAV
jgi:hypothetical protein